MTLHLRVWRRVRVLRSITMNIGKRGASSFTFGRRGLRYTIGRRLTRATIGFPGTGIFLTDVEERSPSAPRAQREGRAIGWIVLALIIIAAVLAFIGAS
jgi:hypothetical protein